MKTIQGLKVSKQGDQITITGTLVEQEFRLPVQQVTQLHFAEGNPHHCRHVQMSNEALFIKRGGAGLALPLEEWVTEVANILEPKLASPPKFGKANKGAKEITVKIQSELQPTLQWQAADIATAAEADWHNIEGATNPTLVTDALPKNKWVRCLATSEAGATATPPVKII